MIGKFIARHKLSIFLAFVGGVAWFATGDVWSFVIGLGFVVLAATFTKLFRTILWLALGVYAGYAIPNGWIFVVVLFALFPLLGGITPVGDFRKGKPGKYARRRTAVSDRLAAVFHALTCSRWRSPAIVATARAIAWGALGGS